VLFSVAVVGITLQLAQHEDATPAYHYFTIWSAAALCVYGSGLLARSRVADSFVRTAGSAGAVFSGLVYLLVLAPVKGLGHEPLTIVANVVLHLVVPSLVVVLHVGHQQWWISPEAIAASLAFPAAYLAWALCVTAFLGIRPAYLFLDSAQVGPVGVFAAVTGAAVAYSLVAWMLSRIVGHRAR
jgi:hypothetical protein